MRCYWLVYPCLPFLQKVAHDLGQRCCNKESGCFLSEASQYLHNFDRSESVVTAAERLAVPVFLRSELCSQPLARIDAQFGACDGLMIDDPLTLPVDVRRNALKSASTLPGLMEFARLATRPGSEDAN